MGALFEEAERDHLNSHAKMRSWVKIAKRNPRAYGKQILNYIWVYIYKFDKHGRFVKYKVRFVVRGD